MEKDVKVFSDIYLDTDSDPKLNKGSDYILNSVLTSDGRYGIVVNVKGNELVTDGSLLSSTFTNPLSNPIKVIGQCVDESRSRIIYFVCNQISVGYDCAIFYYDITDGSNKLIASGTYLGFEYTHTVFASVIGDLLYFTHGTSPKKLNYIKAYNYTNAISTTYKYSTLDANVIEAYKKPPWKPSTTIFYWGSTVLPRKSYQFAVRYIYSDNEKSVLSPFSDMCFTDGSLLIDGQQYVTSSAYLIHVNFDYYGEDIAGTELYVRNMDRGDWYFYDKINRPTELSFTGTASGTTLTVSETVYNSYEVGAKLYMDSTVERRIEAKSYTGGAFTFTMDASMTSGTRSFVALTDIDYYFNDTKVKETVDQKDLDRIFDFIPKTAGCLDIIERNRLVYANITEGYDNIDVNIDHTLVNANATFNIQEVPYTIIPIPPSLDNHLIFSFAPSTDYDAMTYIVTVKKTYFTVNLDSDYVSADYTYYTGYYTAKTGDNDVSIYEGLKSALWKEGLAENEVWVHTTGFYSLRLKTYKNLYNFDGSPSSTVSGYNLGYHSINSVSISTFYKTMKNNDIYLGGIQYFDKNMRYSSIQKFNAPIDTGDTNATFLRYQSLLVNIRNTPPSWAHYYALCFTERTKSGNFIRLKTESSSTGNAITMGLSTYAYFGNKDGFLRIQVNRLINDSKHVNGSLILNNYTFTKGDRIRIYDSTLISLTTYDFEVKGVELPDNDDKYLKDRAATPDYITDANGNKVTDPTAEVIVVHATRFNLPTVTTYDSQSTNYRFNQQARYIVAQDLYFDVYSPKKESESPFYFPVYYGEIGNPGAANAYHKGTSQNQNPLNPTATPAIVACNPGDAYLKLRFTRYLYPAVDSNRTDVYESDYYGRGRANIYDPNAKEADLIAGIRFSGRLLEGTKINELNKFDYNDIVELKSKYGEINFIKEVGSVLKVLQDKKETSIYVGRTELMNADGNSNLSSSQSVLGTVNPSDSDKGTMYPKSVVQNNRNLYYWDSINKCVIRSSPNGQIPISDYGMTSYFKSLTGYTDVVSGFDVENSMFIITFIGSPSVTLGFYDPDMDGIKPRWFSFYSFTPQMYTNIGKYFVSFYNGAGWKHNSGSANRCNFYTVAYKQQINWYSNVAPIIKKIFRSVGIKSNKAWSIPTISIEADASYTRGMLSKLNTNHFSLKEGQYYANYLNNMYTTSASASNVDLMNGDVLRGFYIKHEMENSETVEVWLLDSEVNYDPSNKF